MYDQERDEKFTCTVCWRPKHLAVVPSFRLRDNKGSLGHILLVQRQLADLNFTNALPCLKCSIQKKESAIVSGANTALKHIGWEQFYQLEDS
jgi:hypothetical protein